jgi:DNA-binding MarR family transcriptional regulator
MFERCLYFNLNALTRKVNKIWEQAFQQFDLSPAHAYLLRVVLANPGISQQGIAAELKLEKSTITRFVEALEKKGFLLRNKSGREQFVYPTDTAKALHDDLEQQGRLLSQQMFEQIGKEGMTNLVDHLVQSADKLRKL